MRRPKQLKQDDYLIPIIEDTWIVYGRNSNEKRTALFECTKCRNPFSMRTDRKTQELCLSCANTKKATTHGGRSDVLYNNYDGQKSRCSNPKHRDYKNYGAKGLEFYSEWFTDYQLYKTYVMSLPNALQEGYSLDRVNNDYGYMPMNIRWATHTQQARNKRAIISTNTSGYRGVSSVKTSGKWKSQIIVNKVNISLGTYTTSIEAAKAYDSYVYLHNLEHTINMLELYSNIR